MRLWQTLPALLALAGPASVAPAFAQPSAQEAPAPASPAKDAPGQEAPVADGALPAARTPLGDWVAICNAAPSRAAQVCEADISLTPDEAKAPVARVAFFSEGAGKPVKLVAIVQANLTLAPGVEVTGDGGKVKVKLAFKSCLNMACLADAVITPEDVELFRAARESGRLIIVNSAGEKLEAKISPKGLKEALDIVAPR
ncbi:invasion associated locus B family protein [Methylocella sp.]|uniref:invasion associated locus B family protein n=1 Tax=Methylocella sp. TaxID=1978226 RepID=UPI0037834FD7